MERKRKVSTAIVLAVTLLFGMTTSLPHAEAVVYGAELSPIEVLEHSITYKDADSDGEVSFIIPVPGAWNIHIAGRAEYADGFSMSLHYLEEENETRAWKAGQPYIVPVDSACKELTMDVTYTAANGTKAEKSIDLLALRNLSLSSGSNNSRYTPVYSPWAEDYINDAARYGILPASLRECNCKDNITREEFCDLAYETMGYMAGYIAYYNALTEANANDETDFFEKYGFAVKPIGLAVPTGKTPFSDTDNAHIAALYAAGIVEGKGNNTFAPHDSLTREEAAAIVGRMAAHFELQRFDDAQIFSDAGAISAWATDAVARVCGMGLMVGSDGSFSPQAAYTREQAVAVAIRLVNSVPYLQNREEIAEGKYFIFNSMYLWVEDAERNVTLKLPHFWETYNYRTDYGYNGVRFFTHDGKLIAAAFGKEAPSETEHYTSFFDADTGEKLFSLENAAGYAGDFYALTIDGKHIITEKTVPGAEVGTWRTYYGVYTFEGKVLMPTMYDWDALRNAGYVNTEYSVQYIWK